MGMNNIASLPEREGYGTVSNWPVRCQNLYVPEYQDSLRNSIESLSILPIELFRHYWQV
jgi:hypothetical protein